MSNNGVPLRIIQEVSGHRSLDILEKYLEVRPDQVLGAISGLSILTPVNKSRFDDKYVSSSRQKLINGLNLFSSSQPPLKIRKFISRKLH
jgi:integrase/recombinase XerD